MDELLNLLYTLEDTCFLRLTQNLRQFQKGENSTFRATDFEVSLKSLLAKDPKVLGLLEQHARDIPITDLEKKYKELNESGENPKPMETETDRDDQEDLDSHVSRSRSRRRSYSARTSISRSRSHHSRSRSRSSQLNRSRSPHSSHSRGRDSSNEGSSYAASLKGSHAPTYNIFVGELHVDVTDDDLKKAFEPCGDVYSCNVIREKGYGFVNFQKQSGRDKALTCTGMYIKGKRCRVHVSESRTTLYIGNISENVKSADLKDFVIKRGGPIVDLSVKTGFCFVTYSTFQEAEMAMDKLKEEQFDGNDLKVQMASKNKHDTRSRIGEAKPSKTLYLRNIANEVDEDELRESFEEFGKVVRVTINSSQRSSSATRNSHFGFVEFEELDSAKDALQKMNDKSIRDKTLRVEYSRPAGARPRRSSPRSSGRRERPRERRVEERYEERYDDKYEERRGFPLRREVGKPRPLPPPTFNGMPLMGYDERLGRYVVLTPEQTRQLTHKWAMELLPILSRRSDRDYREFDDLPPPPKPSRSSRSSRKADPYDDDYYVDIKSFERSERREYGRDRCRSLPETEQRRSRKKNIRYSREREGYERDVKYEYERQRSSKYEDHYDAEYADRGRDRHRSVHGDDRRSSRYRPY